MQERKNKKEAIFLPLANVYFLILTFLPINDLKIFQDDKNSTQFSFFLFTKEMTQDKS